MSTTADALIAVATSQLGYYVKPGGVTKFGEWYGLPTGQWCAMFVSWAAEQSGNLDVIPKHAYTPNGANWFKARGQWTSGTRGIRRGDIVYFDFPGAPDRISHVAIVESVNSDGSFNTIEGNTSGTVGGDQRNGGLCARKRRSSYAVGYGRPAYSGSSTGSGVRNWLQKGDQGPAVADMQARLIKVGISVGATGADGVFGDETEKGLRTFQARAGIAIDGFYGPVSKAKLIEASNQPVAPVYRDCTGLQRAVRATQDNWWGPDTDKRVNAVRMASDWKGNQFPYGIAYTQAVCGANPDGRWGPKSDAAHDATVRAIQAAVGAKVDTRYGPDTDARVLDLRAHSRRP